MSLPTVAPEMVHAGDNRFLRRLVPMLGVSLSEMDYLRGWKDDFLGMAIADQYTQQPIGAGSTITLRDGAHGGELQLRAGDDSGRYARLWLGDSADGYDTLDADEGWVQLVYGCLTSAALVNWRFGAADSTIADDVIYAGLDTNTGANWILITRDDGGAWNTVDSGIAADTSYHWHALDVYPISGGKQVDHYLDGRLINYTTTEVPEDVITANTYCMSRTGANKYFYLNYWAVIPRNLTA